LEPLGRQGHLPEHRTGTYHGEGEFPTVVRPLVDPHLTPPQYEHLLGRIIRRVEDVARLQAGVRKAFVETPYLLGGEGFEHVHHGEEPDPFPTKRHSSPKHTFQLASRHQLPDIRSYI
jgi:hypothetical protein